MYQTGGIDGVEAGVSAQLLYLDAAVEEVFATMMSIRCLPGESPAPAPDSPRSPGESMMTAVVGLAGALSGACILRVSSAAAARISSALLGMEAGGPDGAAKDAVGEICNMLAGAWKGKIPELAAGCMLSVPAVVSGRDYALHLQKPGLEIERNYRFENHAFSVTILCEAS